MKTDILDDGHSGYEVVNAALNNNWDSPISKESLENFEKTLMAFI